MVVKLHEVDQMLDLGFIHAHRLQPLLRNRTHGHHPVFDLGHLLQHALDLLDRLIGYIQPCPDR